MDKQTGRQANGETERNKTKVTFKLDQSTENDFLGSAFNYLV